MYTILDEQRKANFIKNYIETHPNCTRKDIVQNTVTDWMRLKYLERKGYFKLPTLTPIGERNGLFRKSS
jgi:hypothetical protein